MDERLKKKELHRQGCRLTASRNEFYFVLAKHWPFTKKTAGPGQGTRNGRARMISA